jgi:hypothetical protein
VTVALADLWAVELVVAAFAGGAFGAAVGALPSFALMGLVVIVGELYALVVRTLGVDPAVDVTGAIAFGPVLGPHVAFGGGAAALAYAVRRGHVDAPGFDYHPAKEVTVGLGSRPDVLAVGGAFGVFGYWVATLSGTYGVPVDPVALGVVASALAHRVAFGYSVVGAPLGELVDMSPFARWEAAGPDGDGGGDGDGDRGDPEVTADGGNRDRDASADGGGDGDVDGDGDERTAGERDGRPPVEPWLPYQYRWSHVGALGLVVGALSAYLAYLTASPFLAFGIAVVALAFLVADVARIPVTHHVALPASTAPLALVDAPLSDLTPGLVAGAVGAPEALAVGAAFGLAGALLGELLQRVLYAHAETHLDPPAASIVVTSAAIGVLALAGAVPSSVWVPLP